MTQETLLRLPDVLARTGWKRTSLYELIKRGRFPAPVKLGERAVAWPESAVTGYIAERIAQSRAAQRQGAR